MTFLWTVLWAVSIIATGCWFYSIGAKDGNKVADMALDREVDHYMQHEKEICELVDLREHIATIGVYNNVFPVENEQR